MNAKLLIAIFGLFFSGDRFAAADFATYDTFVRLGDQSYERTTN